VYVTNYWSDGITAFSLTATTGALAELSASPYDVAEGGHPAAVVAIRIAQ
jgi:hypothetical protein